MRRKVIDIIARLAPLFVFLVFWQVAAHHIERGEYFFGSPASVARYAIEKTLNGSLLVDLGVTALETILGFVLGTVLGTVFGIALGYWPSVARIARPYVIMLGVIPIFAVAPILIIWFGIGLLSKVVMATLSTVFIATFQAYEGVCNVEPDHVFLLQTMRATRWQIFRRVVFPSAAAWVMAGIRLNVGFAILGAFIGEFIASSHGLGQLIITATGLFNIPLALTGVLGICFLALVLVGCCAVVERLLAPWRRAVVRDRGL